MITIINQIDINVLAFIICALLLYDTYKEIAPIAVEIEVAVSSPVVA